MAAPADPQRAEIGRRLQRRRVEIDRRYSNRRVFCADTGLNYKLVQDIEKGRRGNFDTSTLARIALAYRWKPGSIEALVEGGEPVDSEGAPAPFRRRWESAAFAAALAALLDATGRTQREAAALAQVDEAEVSRWKSGARRPGYRALMALREATPPAARGLADALLDAAGYGAEIREFPEAMRRLGGGGGEAGADPALL